jgi:hypothetical protein
MMHLRRAVACCGALAVSLVAISSTAQAADPASNAAAASAVSWLKTQQQSDGGFNDAFPGFETRDATLAIAEQAQTGATWSSTEGLAAVQATQAAGTNKTPLDFLEQDPAVIGAGGSAAKTIVLTTAPLGLDPASFGSFGDPAAPVNLVTLMGGCSASSDSAFNGLLYILVAEKLACGTVSATGLAAVRAAQQSNGGWNFSGDPTGTEVDIDTSAVAVEALTAGGADASDPAVHAALAFFAANQQSSGAWQSFGSDDPNSTSLAVIGIAAVGFDPESSCWRDTVVPASAGTAYTSPDAWLRSQQRPDGRITSPNDGFGVNTFATSQTVEGLLRAWLPVDRAAAPGCGSPEPVVDTTTPVAGGPLSVSGGGFAPSTALTITLHSDPVVLATVTSASDGTYSASVVIPLDAVPGAHEIVVSGLGPDGAIRTVSTPITVLAAAVAAAPVDLAPRFTG